MQTTSTRLQIMYDEFIYICIENKISIKVKQYHTEALQRRNGLTTFQERGHHSAMGFTTRWEKKTEWYQEHMPSRVCNLCPIYQVLWACKMREGGFFKLSKADLYSIIFFGRSHKFRDSTKSSAIIMKFLHHDQIPIFYTSFSPVKNVNQRTTLTFVNTAVGTRVGVALSIIKALCLTRIQLIILKE